jgi:hypothetical protein
MIQEGKTRRSYTEVMALTKPMARVRSWLKEASIGSDKHVLGTKILGLTQKGADPVSSETKEELC